MSEERLQEIKDSIDFQDMWCKEHNMDNILAKEEQELVEEIERLHSIIKEATEYIEKSKLNPLNTYCKYLYVDYDTGEIEHLDELLDILKGRGDK